MSRAKDWDDKINPENEKLKNKKSKEKKLERNPNVDLYLSTIDTLLDNKDYELGRFIKRLLRRFNLVDDFWMKGIACCQYNPHIRRISVKINPMMMWDYLLRHIAVKKVNPSIINAVDREIHAAFEDGGWQPERFKFWIQFLTSQDIMSSDRSQLYGGSSSSFVTCFLAVIVHEVLHCAWNHLSKDRSAKDHKLANIAQDFAINQTLDFTYFNKMFMTTDNVSLLYAFFEGGAPLVDDKEVIRRYKKMRKALGDEDNKTFGEQYSQIKIEDFDDVQFLNQPFEYYYSLLIQAGESLKQVLKNSGMRSSSGNGPGGKCPNCNGTGKVPSQSSDSGGDSDQGQGGSGSQPEGQGGGQEADQGEEVCPVCGGSGHGPSDRGGDMYDFFQHVLGQEEDTEGMSQEEKEQAIKDAMGRSNSGISQFEGFNPATSEMKKVLGNDIKRTVDEMLARGEINDPSDLARERPFNLNKAFVKAIEGLYKTDTKDWDRLLKNQIMKCLGMRMHDYTMKREARGAPGMFPGKARLKSFDLIIVMDVSGSINHDDYNRFVNEIEKIAKQVDHPMVRYIQFHSKVSLDITVPLKHVRKVGIPETGGTNMCEPLNMLRDERNKKLVIIFTDGWVESDLENNYLFPSIVFVSSSGNSAVCQSLLERKWRVIHQDGDNDWWH